MGSRIDRMIEVLARALPALGCVSGYVWLPPRWPVDEVPDTGRQLDQIFAVVRREESKWHRIETGRSARST